MNCPNCNAENMEGAKFCLKCGAPLTGDFVTYEPKINEEKSAGEEVRQEQIKPEENFEPNDYNPFKMIMPEYNEQPQEDKPAEDIKIENNIDPQGFNAEDPVAPEIIAQPQEFKPAGSSTPVNDFEPQEFKPVTKKEEKQKEPKEPKVHKKMNKGLKTALIAVAAIVVIVGGFRLIFPREFYQLTLNDSKYNQYLLAQEAKSIKNSTIDLFEDSLTAKESYSYESSMNVDLGTSAVDMIPEEYSDFATSLVDYLNTLKFKGQTTVKGLDSKQNVKIIDNNGTLVTMDTVKDGSISYFKINELSNKWFKMSPQGYQVNNFNDLIDQYQKMSKEEKQLKCSASELAKTLLSVYDVAKIEIKGGQTLTVGDESVKGDKSSITITGDQLTDVLNKTQKQAKNDDDLYRALKAYYDKTKKSNGAFAKIANDEGFTFTKEDYKNYIDDIFNDLKDSELKTLTIDQYINRKNEIIGFQIKFDYSKKEDGAIISYINNKKDSKPQIAFEIKSLDEKLAKDEVILFQLKGEDDENGKISAEIKMDGDSGKINAVYKDLKQKDDFLLGQIDVTFSNFKSESEDMDEFNNIKIAYKSVMKDKTDKVTFSLDAGDLGKLVFKTDKQDEKPEAIKPASKAIELLDSDNNLTSKANTELNSAMEGFYSKIMQDHQDFMTVIQEGILTFSSSLSGDESDSAALDDEDLSDYSGLI